MRKFLNPKFWFQGTLLGYPKARLAKGIPKIFSHMPFLTVLMVTKLPSIPIFMENLIFTGDHYSHLWLLLVDNFSVLFSETIETRKSCLSYTSAASNVQNDQILLVFYQSFRPLKFTRATKNYYHIRVRQKYEITLEPF